MTSASQQYNDFKLFVGNMACDVSVDEISSVFSKFGQVYEVHIMSGTRSRSGQSSAFVKFTNLESCREAIAGLHMRERIRPTDTDMMSVRFAKAGPSPTRAPCPEPQIIGAVFEPKRNSSFIMLDSSTTAASTPISTPLATPTYRSTTLNTGLTKLFVGGLPTYIDRDDLIAIFAPFGRVESVHLMGNNKSKSGQSCGFINFYSKADASRAIDSLGGNYIVDEDLPAITVRFADNHEEGSAAKRQKILLVSSVDEVAKKLAEQAALEILGKSV